MSDFSDAQSPWEIPLRNKITDSPNHHRQGDFCVIHPVTGNISFLGRADGVLNPSGVRFGSAEIYSVIERHFANRVHDSLCVGQRRPTDQDETVMLFLLMKPGHRFDTALVSEVREAIKRDLSKRHVPKYIFETPEIPVSIFLLQRSSMHTCIPI